MNNTLRNIAVSIGLLFTLPVTALAAGDAAAGQQQAVACGACHGADGNSMVPTFPKLAGLGEKYLHKQLLDIQSGERVVAEMTGQLDGKSDQELADLAAYFDSKTRQWAGAKEERLDLGEAIYRGGNIETGVPACTGCHSPRGNGNAPAGYPAIGGQFSTYIAKQLRAFRTAAHDPENPAGRKNDGDNQIMRGVTEHMSDLEIDAVANFVAGLQ